MERVRALALSVILVLLPAAGLHGAIIDYHASVFITWNNAGLGYGGATTKDFDVTVTIDHTGPDSFDVLAIGFGPAWEPGVNLWFTLESVGGTGASVMNGTATIPRMGFAGTAGPYTLDNAGGRWAGTLHGAGGTRFTQGDTLTLQETAYGTWTPTVNSCGNWDLLTSAPTQIVFHNPEPASLLLWLIGCTVTSVPRSKNS